MGWTTVLKAGKPLLRWTMRGGKATIESVGSAVIHPQRTLKGLGTATKTAAIGGAVGYVGWEKLTTDNSVAGLVGDAVLRIALGSLIDDLLVGDRDLARA